MDNSQHTYFDRDSLYKSHPVITKRYQIITPVVCQAYGMVRERVYMRKTGTFMYATPRMGKTTCAKIIKVLLEKEFPTIFILNFIAARRTRRAPEDEVLCSIMHASMLLTPRRIIAAELQRNLIVHIQTQLSVLNGDQFVLMVDEMQHLGDQELDCLATLHNKLDMVEISMTTIGFAQPDILDVRGALQASNKTYLIARFLCEPVKFTGCISICDLKAILNDYDLVQYFPENSGCSFTKFFLPKAFDNGFRLSEWADAIWKVLKSSAGKSSESIPMEHLSRTIEYLLVAASNSDSHDFKIKIEDIDAAVHASNLSYFNGLLDVN